MPETNPFAAFLGNGPQEPKAPVNKSTEEIQAESIGSALMLKSVAYADNPARPTSTEIYPTGTRPSKYDAGMTNPESRYDLEEYRANNQTSGDKIANGLIKAGSQLGTSFVGGTAGSIYGLVNAIGKRELNAFYNNAVFEGLNRWDQGAQEMFPHYYTKKEQELGGIGNLNFWSDQFLNGMSFMAGAVLTELAITGLSGGMASGVAGLGIASRLKNLSGVARATSRLRNLSRATRGIGGSLDDIANAEGWLQRTGSGLYGMGRTGRQIITGAGYESAVESMHTYESMSETRMNEEFSDRFEQQSRALGRSLTMEEKREMLSPEEKKRIHDSVVDVTNLVFAGNMMLVGGANMVNLGKWFRPKMFGNASSSMRPNSVLDDLLLKKVSQNTVRNIRAGGSYLGRILSEAGQEMGQGMLNRWGDEYALTMASEDNGAVSLLTDMWDHIQTEEWARFSTMDPEMVKEGLLGALVAAVGLPGHFGFSPDLGEAQAHMDLYHKSRKEELDRLRTTLTRLQSEDPSVMNNLRQLVTMYHSVLGRAESQKQAASKGDAFEAKNFEEDDLIDNVLYHLETGAIDDMSENVREMEDMSTEEFKKLLGFNSDMSEEEVRTRRAELVSKSRRMISEVTEATRRVDEALKLSPEERYLNTLDPNSKSFQRRLLIRSLVTEKESEAREKKLIEEIKEITGGKIKEVSEEVDTIEFGDGQELRLGEMPSGSSPEAVLQDIRTRKQMLSTIPIGQRTAVIQTELNKLMSLEKSLGEHLNSMSAAEIKGEMKNSTEDLMIKEWMVSDPIQSSLHKDLGQKLKDVRKLRMRRQQAIETFQALMDPEMAKARMSTIKKVADKAKAAERKEGTAPQDTAKQTKDDATKQRIREFKEKARSYKKLLSSELEKVTMMIQDSEKRLESATETHLALQQSLAKMDKAGWKTINVKLLGEKMRLSREELETAISIAEEDLATAKAEMPVIEKLKDSTIKDLEEMMRTLELIEGQDPELAKELWEKEVARFQPEAIEASKWLTESFEEYEEEVELPNGKVSVKKVRPIPNGFLRSVAQGMSERLGSILDAAIEEVTEKISAMETLLETAKAALKVAVDPEKLQGADAFTVDKEEVEGIRQALDMLKAQLDDLKKQKKRNDEYGEFNNDIGYNAVRFLEMLARLEAYDPVEEVPESDLPPTEELVERGETMDEDSLKRKDVSDIISTTGRILSKEDLSGPGAMETYTRLLPGFKSKSLSPEELKQFKIAESQLDWNHWLGSGIQDEDEGMTRFDTSYSLFSNGKVVGNGLLMLHQNNVQALPEEIRSELSQYLYDETSILTALVVSKDGKFHLYRNEEGRPLLTHLATDSLTDSKGKPRYTNKRDLPTEELQARSAAFRKEVLSNPNLMVTAIAGKGTGTINLDDTDRKASETVTGNLADVHLAFVTPVVELEEDKVPTRKVGNMKIHDKVDPTKKRVLGEIRVLSSKAKGKLGTIWAYDHVRRFLVPMRRQRHDEQSSREIMSLFAKQISIYNEEIEKGGSVSNARQLVKSHTLTTKDGETNLYALTEDLIETVHKESKWHLHLRLSGKEAVVTYGETREPVSLNDILDMNEKGRGLQQFLMTKFRNVNKATSESGVTLIDKDKNGKQLFSNQKRYKAQKPWTYVRLDEKTLEPKYSEGFKSYNEFILKGVKGGTPSLMTHAVPYRTTKENPRSFGGYLVLRATTTKAPGFAIQTLDNEFRTAAPAEEPKKKAKTEEVDGIKLGQEKKGRLTGKKEESDPNLVGDDPISRKLNEDPLSMEAQEEALEPSDDEIVMVDRSGKGSPDAQTVKISTGKKTVTVSKGELMIVPAAGRVTIGAFVDGMPITIGTVSAEGTSWEIPQLGSSAALLESWAQDAMPEDAPGDVPFMQFIGEPAQKETEREKEIAEANRMTLLEVRMIKGFLTSMDGPAQAQLIAHGRVLLSRLSQPGAIFHEAFHNIELYVLSPSDRARVYSEVRSRPGQTVTFRGELKDLSALTDKECSEWLAEEFRKTTLDPDRSIGAEDKVSLVSKVIQFIRTLVRTLLRLNEDLVQDSGMVTLEEFFKGIRTGKFNIPSRSNPAPEVSDMKVFNGTTVKYTKDMVDMMMGVVGEMPGYINSLPMSVRPQSFQRLFSIYDIYNVLRKGTPEEANFLGTVRWEILQGKLDTLPKGSVERANLERALREVSAGKRLHITLIGDRLRDLLEIRKEKKGKEEEEDEKKDQIEEGKENWQIEEDEVSVLKKVPPVVKLLLATLPSGKKNSTGLEGAVEISEVLRVLGHELDGKHSLQEILEHLRIMDEGQLPDPEKGIQGISSKRHRYPWIRSLRERLGDGFDPSLSYGQIQLLVEFSRKFYTVTHDPALPMLTPEGTVYISDPAYERAAWKIKLKWRTNLLSNGQRKGYVSESGQGLTFNSSKLFQDQGMGQRSLSDISRSLLSTTSLTGDISFELKALGLLGVQFTSPERVEELVNSGQQAEFSAAVKAIFSAVTRGEAVSLYDRTGGSSVAARFNYLIRLEMMTSGEPVGKTFWNANNRMQFTSQRPNVLGIVMSLKEGMGRWLDPQRNRWVHGSVLLDHLLSGNMRVVSVEGLRPQTSGEVGDKVTKLNKTDLYVSYISALLGDVMLSPRAADQASEVAFSIGSFGNREDLNTVLGDRDTILKGYLVGEMLAIHASKNRLHLKDFNKKGQRLRFFTSMLSPISVSRVEEAALGLEEKDFERFINRNWKTFSKEISESFARSAKETMEDMVREGVFVQGKDSALYSTGLDLSKLTGLADLKLVEGSQGNRLWGQDRVLALAEELEWRKFVSNVEFFKLFGGDPAFYKALLKRIKVLMGGRTPMEMDPELQEWTRRTSHGPLHVRGNMARAIVVKEPSTRTPAGLVASISEVASAFAAQKYAKGGDSSDGTMIVNLDTYRYMQLSTSLWSQAKEDAYQRLRLARNERSYENGGSFVPDKFIYAGPAEFAEDMEALGITMFKMSVVPIWSDLAFVGDELYPNIQTTLDFMDKEQAAFIVMPSAVKVGSPDTDVQTSYMTETGRMVFDRMGTGSIIDVDLRFMSSQVKVSSFSKGKVTTAVQMRVHAESDMYDGGLPHMLPQEGERDPYEVAQEYVAVMEALTELRKEKLMNTLGIVQTPEGYLFDPSKRKEFTEFLDEELENKDLDHTVQMSLQRYLDSLPNDEPFRLDMVMNSRDLEGILFSAASKKVVKAKVAGEMAVLQSDFGFEYVRKVDGTEGVSRLKFYREKDENGRQFMSMEVYLPHRFKELLPIGDAVLVDSPKGKVFQIRDKAGAVIKEMNPIETHQILQMVGTRIPTDGLHSMEVLRVKGFLPQEAGPRVVVPGELVIKAGCDFDIDKLTMYFKDLGFNVSKDGKISLRVDEYYSNPEDWFLTYQSKAQRYLESATADLTTVPELETEMDDVQKMMKIDRMIKAQLERFFEEAGLDLEDAAELPIGLLIADDLQEAAFKKLKPQLRQLFDAEGRPYTFEEWSAMNPDASLKTINTTRSLHNRMIMLMAEMMSMKERQSELFEPVNTSGLEEVAKEIQGVYDSKKNSSIPNLDSVSDLFNDLSLRAQVRVTKAYMEAKQTVGVFALHSTHHVKTQKSGLQVVPEKKVTIEFEGPQSLPMTLNFESTAGAPVEFGRLNGFNTPGQRDGERISRILSQLVNAAVDMVNTPLLHKLNISMDTAPVAVMLIRAGVPLRTVALFLNQDSVKEFIKASSYNSSHLIGTVEDARGETGELYSDALIGKVAKKYQAGDFQYGPLSDDVLKEMMGYTSETVPEELRQRWTEVQRQVLRDYLMYTELAQALTDLTNGQAFDTKVPMSRAEAKLKRAKYMNVLNSGMFVSPESVMTGGSSGSFMNGLNNFNAELGALFDSMSPLAHTEGSPLNSIYGRMIGQLSRIQANVDDQVLALTRMEQGFITFLLQRMSYSDNTGTHRPQDDLERLLFGKDSIAQRVSDIQNSDSHPLKDNLWLNSVLPVMSAQVQRKKSTGFKLSIDKKGKDQGKASLSNAFIGYGIKGSSTAQYLEDAKAQGIPINEGIEPTKDTIAFVSVNGNGKLTEEARQKTLNQIKRVLDAGGTVIMDSTADAQRAWNLKGEAIIQKALKDPDGTIGKGYNYWGSPNVSSADMQNTLPSQNNYLQQVQGSTVDGEDIYLYDAFMEIMAEDQKLARDLIHAAMLQAGTLYSPFNFTSMIPGELFTDIAMQAIRQYEANGYSFEEGSSETWQEIYLTLMANLMRFRGMVRVGGMKKSKAAPYLSTSRQIRYVDGKFQNTLYVEDTHMKDEHDWSQPLQIRKWKTLPSSITDSYSEMTIVNSELLSLRDLKEEKDKDNICRLEP